jgi:ABC-2 type transport system ATP-binding protein
MNIIETYDLSKSYGRLTAVDQVNLAIPAGSIYGIVGAGGSGKTTLLRILATLVSPTAGDAMIAGALISGSPTRIRRVVGYMPDGYGVYPDMTVEEYLGFYAASYGVPASDQAALVNDLLALVDMSHRRTELLSRLTRGMLQRLSLARTLAHDPQILLLDEPISGADPRAHVELRELIKELHNMGKTVVVSASIVADVANLCTDIAIIEQGRIVLAGQYSAVYQRLHHHRIIVVKFFGNASLAQSILRSYHGVRDVLVIASSNGEDKVAGDDAQGIPPVVVTVLKEIQVAYDGAYQDATDMLRMLMRSGVQVVSFGELDDSAQRLILRPAEPTTGEGE